MKNIFILFYTIVTIDSLENMGFFMVWNRLRHVQVDGFCHIGSLYLNLSISFYFRFLLYVSVHFSAQIVSIFLSFMALPKHYVITKTVGYIITATLLKLG